MDSAMYPTLTTPLFRPTALGIMSIRSPYAEAILAGHKQIELRRISPRFPVGLQILIYQPCPVQAIIGSFTVGGVIGASPTALWDAYHQQCFVTEAVYKTYFTGATRAYGIWIENPISWMEPLTLAQLQKIWSAFRPPQSYLFVHPQHLAYSFLKGYLHSESLNENQGAPNRTPPALHSARNAA